MTFNDWGVQVPDLAGSHEFLENKPLKLVFNLSGVEHPERWEGWLIYELRLLNGSDVITSRSGLTIIDDDVEGFCRLLEGKTTEEFEPIEPDFQALLRPTKRQDDSVELLIFLDEGMRRSNGFSGQGVGLRLLVERDSIDEFVKEIRKQHATLTKNLRRTV